MTKIELEDIAEVLHGYDSWRSAQAQVTERDLSVSAYLDEFAKLRALEIVSEIQSVYADGELAWSEVDARIRALIGAA